MDVEPPDGVGSVGGDDRNQLVGDRQEEGCVGVEETSDQRWVRNLKTDGAKPQGLHRRSYLLRRRRLRVRGRSGGG